MEGLLPSPPLECEATPKAGEKVVGEGGGAGGGAEVGAGVGAKVEKSTYIPAEVRTP